MEFSVKSGNPEKQRTACVVVGIYEPRRLSVAAEQLDKASDAYHTARKRLVEGKGNLIGRTEKLKKLGAKTKKSLDEKLLLEAAGDDEE